jgi:hypothetical protein
MSSFVELSSWLSGCCVSSFISRSGSTVQLIRSYNRFHIKQLGWPNPGWERGQVPHVTRRGPPCLERVTLPALRGIDPHPLPKGKGGRSIAPPPRVLPQVFLRRWSCGNALVMLCPILSNAKYRREEGKEPGASGAMAEAAGVQCRGAESGSDGAVGGEEEGGGGRVFKKGAQEEGGRGGRGEGRLGATTRTDEEIWRTEL